MVEELSLYLFLMSLPSAKLTPPHPQMSQLTEKERVLVPYNKSSFRSFCRGKSPWLNSLKLRLTLRLQSFCFYLPSAKICHSTQLLWYQESNPGFPGGQASILPAELHLQLQRYVLNKLRFMCSLWSHPTQTHLHPFIKWPFFNSTPSNTIQVSWHQKSRSGISPVEASSLHTAGEWL